LNDGKQGCVPDVKGKSVTRARTIAGAQKKGKCRADALAATSSKQLPSFGSPAVEKFVENCRKLSADKTCASAA
jgi:hypothetical protein